MTCEKKRYLTRAHAEAECAKYRRALQQRRGKGGDQKFLQVYLCRYCGQWHLGRAFRTQRELEREAKAKPAASPKQKPHSWGYIRKRVERISLQIDRERQKRIEAIHAVVEADLSLWKAEREYQELARHVTELFLGPAQRDDAS